MFICEEPVRGRAVTSCGEGTTEADFTLNVWDLKRDIVYKNDETYDLMRALDVEDSIGHLRCEKVILAKDADVDGLHPALASNRDPL